MGISSIESMTLEIARNNLRVFASITAGQKLRFDPNTLRFSKDGNALTRTFRNINMGESNSSIMNDATFNAPIVFSFSRFVMEDNDQILLNNAVRGMEILEQTYFNEDRRVDTTPNARDNQETREKKDRIRDRRQTISNLVKQVRKIAAGRSQMLINQFNMIGSVTNEMIEFIKRDQNSDYLLTVFNDNSALELASVVTYNEIHLTEYISTLLKRLDSSYIEPATNFRDWIKTLIPIQNFNRYFQKSDLDAKASFKRHLKDFINKPNVSSDFLHYDPILPLASNQQLFRIYLCPHPQFFVHIINSIVLYMTMNPNDHGLNKFKHLVDKEMRFEAKDRMLIYIHGLDKAKLIGEAIYKSSGGMLIVDRTAATINTTEFRPGVYFAPEPGHVSTGMDPFETTRYNARNQQEQTVTLLSANMISMALVNWINDYKARISTGGRTHNPLEILFNSPKARETEYQLFLKYLAVAMKTYENQFAGDDMVNDPSHL